MLRGGKVASICKRRGSRPRTSARNLSRCFLFLYVPGVSLLLIDHRSVVFIVSIHIRHFLVFHPLVLTLTVCPLPSESSPSADSSPRESPATTMKLANHGPLPLSDTDQAVPCEAVRATVLTLKLQ